MFVGGFVHSSPPTGNLFIAPSITNLCQLLVWWLLVWQVPVCIFQSIGRSVWMCRLMVLGLLVIDLWQVQWKWVLRHWVQRPQVWQLSGSSNVRYIVSMLLKPPVSPRLQNARLSNLMLEKLQIHLVLFPADTTIF